MSTAGPKAQCARQSARQAGSDPRSSPGAGRDGQHAGVPRRQRGVYWRNVYTGIANQIAIAIITGDPAADVELVGGDTG